MYLDNVVFDSQITAVATADNNFYGAVAFTSYLAAALGNRPSAGSHTLKVTFQTTAASFGCTVQADSANPLIICAPALAAGLCFAG